MSDCINAAAKKMRGLAHACFGTHFEVSHKAAAFITSIQQHRAGQAATQQQIIRAADQDFAR
jgi:hypothetical protein